MEGVPVITAGTAGSAKAEGAAAMPPPPPVSPPALTPAPAAGEEGQPPLPEAGAPGCSGSRPPELEPERSLGRLRGRFEDEDEELEEDEDLEEEEEEEEEEEMSHFSLRLEGGRPDSEDEEERLINLSELTPYILCSICKGYLIDATTITECLHTFCKSCIVRHFYYSNRCPKCNIVVHQTQPLYNIRLDRQLQDIVYKLVINLEEREKKQMHDFYKERGLEVPKPAVPQPVPSSKGRSKKVLESVFRIPPELDMSLLLEFIGKLPMWQRVLLKKSPVLRVKSPHVYYIEKLGVTTEVRQLRVTHRKLFHGRTNGSANEGTGHFKPLEKKFVRVSGEATIGHVEKFLRRKMGLDPACQVDIICGDHLLERYQTLREIRRAIGDAAMQDGLLVLHYGLVVSPLKIT
ncbi:polycomb group RING finger protein 6 isoform X1 [Physeter macrocephalus]|uniref:Polycomb group RING finger protein 6 n=1 Tax=Physeter macrocephalus TaxID=9755 RepID=A0A2Y9FU79_PHYMC|nr:polycomb group RING finger protein 6 isoform X1 [Physeter catodon]|eukprot:XP_007130615.2 polycomb group RING finger protein 6 isoform X1 [Physeter catodon]